MSHKTTVASSATVFEYCNEQHMLCIGREPDLVLDLGGPKDPQFWGTGTFKPLYFRL